MIKFTRTFAAALIVALAALATPVNYAQDGAPTLGAGAPDLDAYDSSEESSFYNRTPEEYRDAILKATNKAQIDAFICQQLVQEMREQGADYTDEEFYDILAEEEYRLERQRRVEFWVDEQQRLKEEALKPNYKKFGVTISVIIAILLLVAFVGGKRNPEQENQEKEESQGD
jgi:hypothetical protein